LNPAVAVWLTKILPLGIMRLLAQNRVEIKVMIPEVSLYIDNLECLWASLFVGGIQGGTN
jgi:hypothetical protein